MRAHRLLALKTFVPVVVIVAIFLIVTVIWDGLGQIQVGDVNLLWLLLGPVALFSILGVTVLHERRALRLEQQWMDDRR